MWNKIRRDLAGPFSTTVRTGRYQAKGFQEEQEGRSANRPAHVWVTYLGSRWPLQRTFCALADGSRWNIASFLVRGQVRKITIIGMRATMARQGKINSRGINQTWKTSSDYLINVGIAKKQDLGHWSLSSEMGREWLHPVLSG